MNLSHFMLKLALLVFTAIDMLKRGKRREKEGKDGNNPVRKKKGIRNKVMFSTARITDVKRIW